MKRRQMQSPRRTQKGLTLLELSLSVGVGLALIGIGIGVYSTTRSNTDAFKAANEVQQVAAALRDVYSQSNSFAGLTSTTFIQSGKAPRAMVSGSNVLNAYSIPVVITADSATTYGAANGRFSFTYGGVPREQCLSLVMATADAFDAIEVGTSTATGAFTMAGTAVKNSAAGISPTVATATTACDRPVSGIRFIGR